jgi:hypothetical protein
MCDLIRKLQSADKLRSSAGLSTCYRPYAEFLEQQLKPTPARVGLKFVKIASWIQITTPASLIYRGFLKRYRNWSV